MVTVMIDADCGLCTRLLSFAHPLLTDADSVRFVGLDTEVARTELGERYAEILEIDTMVVVAGGVTHLRSAAALQLAARMRVPWRLLTVFRLIPSAIRDAVYSFVARRRGWFGPAVACPVDLARPQA